MAIHFSQLPQHNHAVTSLYRSLLRIAAKLSNKDDEWSSIVRRKFRFGRKTLKSWDARKYLLEAQSSLVLGHQALESSQSLEKLESKYFKPAKRRLKTVKQIETGLEKNRKAEVTHMKKEHSLQGYIKLAVDLDVLNHRFSKKSELDENYLNTIVKSQVLYHKNKNELKRISKLCQEDSKPYELKIVNYEGDKLPIFNLRAPWGFVGKNSRIIVGSIRRKNQLDDEVRALESYFEQYVELMAMECAWEGVNHANANSWTSLWSDYIDSLIEENKDRIQQINKRNAEQLLLKQEIQKQVDEFQIVRRENFKKMQKFLNSINILKYEDFPEFSGKQNFKDLNGDDIYTLGKVMKMYGFKPKI